jgi:Domain of unknown function (DUF4382)
MWSELRRRHLVWVLPVAVVAVAIACGGSSTKTPTAPTDTAANTGSTSGSGTTPGTGTNPGSGGTGTGTLSVVIKDSPFSEATALLVKFTDVSVHKSSTDGTGEGEWVPLKFDPTTATSRTCDLKRLEAETDVLGIGTLPEGHYTQVRLTVDTATIYKSTITTGDICAEKMVLELVPPATSETGTSVTIPSGTLKLNREFTVPAGGAMTMTLDFDGDKSVKQTGNGKYMMTPVIAIVSVQ